MSHYKVLSQTNSDFSILINPAAYKVSMFDGLPEHDAVFACNINYSWLGIAIGHLKSPDSNWVTIGVKTELRPCLCIDKNGFASIQSPRKTKLNLGDYSLVAQAGPTLAWDSIDVSGESIKKEEFRSDAVRRTDHVAIGTTIAGKIIAAFVKNSTPYDLSYYLTRKGCIRAMKCDGGSQTSLWLGDKHYGRTKRSVAGIQFQPK